MELRRATSVLLRLLAPAPGAASSLARWSAALWSAALLSCHDDPFCHEGDLVGCTCDDGRTGYAACDPDAEAFGACSCEGTPGLLPSGDGGGGAGGGELLALYAPCAADEECESGLCFEFNARGPHCTQPCDDASDCPAPSSGCNNKGVCKTQ